MSGTFSEHTELMLRSIELSFRDRDLDAESAINLLRRFPNDCQLTIIIEAVKSGGYCVFTATDTSSAAIQIRRLLNGQRLISEEEQQGG